MTHSFNLRRRSLLAGGVGAFAAIATGCSGGDKGGASGGDGQLRFTWWGNEVRTKATNDAIALFQKDNAGIKVSPENGDWSAYWDKLATQVAANNAPDIIQMDEKYISEYGGRGALLELGAAGVDVSKFQEGSLDSCKLEKGLFGINAGMNAPTVCANVALFEKAGVPLPDDATWTWEDFHKTALALQAKLPEGSFGAQNLAWVEPSLRAWLRQKGKDQWTKDGQGWEPADLEDYFAFCLKMQSDKCTPSATQTAEDMGKALDQTLMATGKTGMAIYWSNQVVALQKAVGGPIKMLRLPSMTGKSADAKLWYKASMMWSISARTKNKEAAVKFVNFLANSTEVGNVLKTERGIPANTDVRKALEASLGEVDKQVVAYLDLIKEELGPAIVVTPVGGGNYNVIQGRHAQDLLFGRTDPAKAAAALHTEVGSQIKK